MVFLMYSNYVYLKSVALLGKILAASFLMLDYILKSSKGMSGGYRSLYSIKADDFWFVKSSSLSSGAQ